MRTLLEKIEAAGVVGCGGAGFPTHAKLKGRFFHIIINGMECEPLLRSDRYVMRVHAEELVCAAAALLNETGAETCTFALKETYREEIAALQTAIAACQAPVHLHTTGSFYPAGDEHVLVYEVTGKTVPPMNIPLAAGCVVINAGTLLSIYHAAGDIPFTKRYLTVAGEVEAPCIVEAPVGAPFSACIALAGGAREQGCAVVSGGPMMGKYHEPDALDALFVEKTTSAILLLKKGRGDTSSLVAVRRQARAACIQCSYCTQLCPRYLLGHPLEPHKIMRSLAYRGPELDDPVIRSAALCCECGVCETYACPMQLKPRQVNAVLKRLLLEQGIRYERPDAGTQPHALREVRKIPTNRAAARAGVREWYGQVPLRRCMPKSVTIALKQGPGAAAVPEVQPGDKVLEGARIASCPAGKLGAHVHASISGRIASVSGVAIAIIGEERI